MHHKSFGRYPKSTSDSANGMAIWDIGTPLVHIYSIIVPHLTDPNVCMRSDASDHRRDDAAYCDERLARNISVAMFCIHYM